MAIDLSFGGVEFPRAFEVRRFLYNNAAMGVSPRFRRLDRLDAWYKCLEYEHQQYDWNGHPAENVETISSKAVVGQGFTQPALEGIEVRQKRPTSPMRLCPMIVDRFTGMLFGAGRAPRITVEGDDDADDFVRAVFENFGFWVELHQSRTYGGSMGTAMVTVKLREGAYSFTAHSPKTIQEVSWKDAERRVPNGVLIQYIFVEEREKLDEKTGQPTGDIDLVPFIYRRIIDEEWDLVFKPAEVRNGKVPEDLDVDEEKSQHHRLGRFPGAIVQNLPNKEELDGVPDCDGTYQMMDTIDRLLAQVNMGLLYNIDPTLVISRDPKMVKMGASISKGSKNALDVGLQGSATYLEMTGAGITSAREVLKEMKQDVMNKAQCVLVDPEKISGAAQSAKAIELIYAPMIEKTGLLREQWGPGIVAIGEVVLALARVWSKPKSYPGNVRPVFNLPPRLVEIPAVVESAMDLPGTTEPTKTEVPRSPGSAGVVSVKWGPYFSPTPNDIQMATTTIASAKDAGLLDRDTAVRLLAPLFDLADVDAILEKLEGAAQNAIADQLAMRGLAPDTGGLVGAHLEGEDIPLDAEGMPLEGEDIPLDGGGAPAPGTEGLPPSGPSNQPPGLPATGAAQDIALNGAQISAAIDIVSKVALQELPRDSGIGMLIAFFNLDQARAEAIMGSVGKTFFVEKPEPKPFGGGGFGKKPPFGKPKDDDAAHGEDPDGGAPPAPPMPSSP